MKSGRCAAVIMAGGFSSRMKRFKPLLPVGDETITDRLISLFWRNNVDVFLVVGWKKEELIAGIKNHDVRIVENPNFQMGMFSSVQAGLRQVLAGEYPAVFIHPVDIPLIRPYTIRRLLEAAESNSGTFFYPSCGAKRGHPPLIPIEMVPTILDWQREGGLKDFLEIYDGLAYEVRVPDLYSHLDIDTPADYEDLLERFCHYEIPEKEEIEVILSDIRSMPPDRVRHCYKVAEVADNLGKALTMAGEKADLDLVRAASILHDIAKGQKDHARAGGNLLVEMGFNKVGNIVSAHSDLPDGLKGSSLETKIVYLADKFVSGENLVTIEQRYDQALERFSAIENIKNEILKRREGAFQVENEFESSLGYPLERIVFV
jgi:molybdenum cofactor cytidylyltransferase